MRVQRGDVLATLTALSAASNLELVSGLRQAGMHASCYGSSCTLYVLITPASMNSCDSAVGYGTCQRCPLAVSHVVVAFGTLAACL